MTDVDQSLMPIKEILDGKPAPMDAAGAAEFASVVRADRLSGLAQVKVGIPNPTLLKSEKHQANVAKIARVYGADTSTDLVALISFEGFDFVIGFSLLRYGEDWTVMSSRQRLPGSTRWDLQAHDAGSV